MINCGFVHTNDDGTGQKRATGAGIYGQSATALPLAF